MNRRDDQGQHTTPPGSLRAAVDIARSYAVPESPDYINRISCALVEASEENELLRRTIRAVNDNALSWHAGEDGKARALNVIAVWTSEALAGRLHPSVEALPDAR